MPEPKSRLARAGAEQAVLSRGWLQGQPAAVQKTFLHRAHLRHFVTGEVVFQVGASPGGLFGVASGSFAIHVGGTESPPHMATILRAGSWFGHGQFAGRRPRILAVQALEAACALHVSLADLDEFTATEPLGIRALAALSVANQDLSIGAVRDLLLPRAEQRITATLLRVTADAEPDAPEGYRLTQAALGEMANASRQLVNRCLAGLERMGWIEQGYNVIRIRDAEALRRFAHGSGPAPWRAAPPRL
ncbi:Crp/Fnr family transcriptional regulator [Roseococcus sp. SDR]|uniref:Crp/Fnr family transcriptional regulator n=1 Tax=Roseococcus sp. SDR TaxID=2835532 RepID=UPI001BD1998F|nr:Crp/Fnr family transcriptional regulator [Roseococcus sp. SDR]MBS7791796.1 Crp/Fnr family transcriptional regulator [Roseococcus sp. SDR]MBV1847110.1 Crp/Fnr family transcriptional regulator [Roseococcus sp. SDR]